MNRLHRDSAFSLVHAARLDRYMVCPIWCFLILRLLSTTVCAADKNATEVRYERLPYQVRLLVAFDPLNFSSDEAASLLREMQQITQRCMGEVWSFHSDALDSLTRIDAVGLQRMEVTTLAQGAQTSADVWFAAVVEVLPSGIRVSVRSWQPEFHLSMAIASREVSRRRDIPVTLFRLCRDLFQPVGYVEQVLDRSVRIRLRAGELVTPDETCRLISAGDLMEPLLAYRDKNKSIEKLQSIPWTCISIEGVDGSTVTGTTQSGLRLALGGKKRGRIDTVVFKLRPQHSSTRIELLTQTKPIVPLAAHRIEVRSQQLIPKPTEQQPDIDPESTLLNEVLTDRRGQAVIDVEPEHPLVWLFAYSGQHLIARVPFVPGVRPTARLEVPDDSTRLSAEADLQMLQGEVIDAVAMRSVAIKVIRDAAKRNDWPTVHQRLELLSKQPDSASLSKRLNAVRVLATSVAKSRKDRISEQRIIRMCDETAELIKAHLADDKLTSLRDEMRELEKVATESDEEKPLTKTKKKE